MYTKDNYHRARFIDGSVIDPLLEKNTEYWIYQETKENKTLCYIKRHHDEQVPFAVRFYNDPMDLLTSWIELE